MDLSNQKTLFNNLKDELRAFNVNDKELLSAINDAYDELA